MGGVYFPAQMKSGPPKQGGIYFPAQATPGSPLTREGQHEIVPLPAHPPRLPTTDGSLTAVDHAGDASSSREGGSGSHADARVNLPLGQLLLVSTRVLDAPEGVAVVEEVARKTLR